MPKTPRERDLKIFKTLRQKEALLWRRLQLPGKYQLGDADRYRAAFRALQAPINPKISRLWGEIQACRDEIAANYTALVFKLVGRRQMGSHDSDDLRQEVVVGLLRALDKYDYKRGTCFSTYAVCSMRGAISISVDTAYTIREPRNRYEAKGKIKRAVSLFVAKHGREPTVEELAQLINMSERRIASMYDLKYASLDAHVVGDKRFVDLFAAETLPPDELISKKQIRKEVHRIIKVALAPREQEIIHRRFGTGNNEPTTLGALGNDYLISRERVRRVQNESMIALRLAATRRKLVA
jgi:RNA polymerase primary sigma factor